jgi:hypothetical protein
MILEVAGLHLEARHLEVFDMLIIFKIYILGYLFSLLLCLRIAMTEGGSYTVRELLISMFMCILSWFSLFVILCWYLSDKGIMGMLMNKTISHEIRWPKKKLDKGWD